MIWTWDTQFTQMVNWALVVDAANSYPILNKDDFSFYFEFLNNNNLYYKTIIDNTVKYMRLLNTCIVDNGSRFNDEDRITYRGIWKAVLPDIEVGETFRIANWVWTSEN